MSRIEQVIDEIEEYLEDCKPSMFSQTKIVVDKDQLEELLNELRAQIPDEVRQYQKIISNQEAILSHAKEQANDILDSAGREREQLVDQHEIMQRAYASANNIIEDARSQGQQIVDEARSEAESMKSSIMKYSDDVMASLESVIENFMDEYRNKSDAMTTAVESAYETITRNRKDLHDAND